jgi:hypothetical protein
MLFTPRLGAFRSVGRRDQTIRRYHAAAQAALGVQLAGEWVLRSGSGNKPVASLLRSVTIRNRLTEAAEAG